MMLDKKVIQKAVEETIQLGKYTEELGSVILLFAEVSVYRRGLKYRFSEFDVEFIIKPKIVDMLLLKVFKYNKDFASAYTYFSLITSTAILDAIKDTRRALKGESQGVYYVEDMLSEIKQLDTDEDDSVFDKLYIEQGLIKLR
tara:strand:+ start:2506 stop:2934 length:429 start_codon:yes stop_codon:yes gene_type:complete